jgi:hypothetical protein
MVLSIKVVTRKERNMAMESFIGPMKALTEGTSLTTILKEMEFMNGQMAESMMVNGRRIKCMEKGSLHGKTAGDMKVNTSMTRKKEKEYSIGQMVGNIREAGIMENNTE